MNDNKHFPVANLSDRQLQQVMSLEQDLRKETNENIVLIAYDEEENK